MKFEEHTCPYCAYAHCSAEWCDVDVGFVQMAPYHCDVCHATEIGAYDKEVPSEAEKAVGWYLPGRLPETVSSVNGVLLDTKTALELYEARVVGHVPFRAVVSDAALLASLGIFTAPPVSALSKDGVCLR